MRASNTSTFPCISTGVYGYPIEDAAKIVVREAEAFLVDHDIEVVFCCFSSSDKAIYERFIVDNKATPLFVIGIPRIVPRGNAKRQGSTISADSFKAYISRYEDDGATHVYAWDISPREATSIREYPLRTVFSAQFSPIFGKEYHDVEKNVVLHIVTCIQLTVKRLGEVSIPKASCCVQNQNAQKESYEAFARSLFEYIQVQTDFWGGWE